jgi:hypothetical protein
VIACPLAPSVLCDSGNQLGYQVPDLEAFMGRVFLKSLLLAALSFAVPGGAQDVRSVDPSAAVETSAATPSAANQPLNDTMGPVDTPEGAATAGDSTISTPGAVGATPTYKKDDVIGAAEGVFGKGAKGLGGMIERVLKEQGEPNAYISGREASAALILGLRYGSGTMTHSVEGQKAVYWTGPSVGFDAGGDAAKVFVLVYNLYDSEDLYRRYPQVEGRAYYVGGFSGTYMRRGNVALIPIRLGVGARLGVNAGYMKFSHKSKWFPL